MACAVLTTLVFISLGIQLSFAYSETNFCGTVSYDEPAVAETIVTLTFKPARVVRSASVRWYTLSLSKDSWSDVSEQWNYHLDNFSLVINTTTDDQWRRFYVRYDRSCNSYVIILRLEVYHCGRLSYDEPAVMGELVTLTYEPVQVDSNVSVEWRIVSGSLAERVSEQQWQFHLDNFSLVINTTTAYQGSELFVTYGSCASSIITLKLEVYNCGRLSYDEPAVAGTIVTLTYEPVQVVSNVPLIWITKPASGWESKVSGQWNNYHLDNFSLVINTTTDDQGRGFYADYGPCYSSYITLKLEERPNNPELLNMERIEDCHNCIAGVLNTSMAIRCKVTGGTAPLQVDITVAGESLNASLGNDGIYTVHIMVTARKHLATVNCSVDNLALDSPLVSEAKLYIPGIVLQ